jgi:TonB family protein
MQPLDSEDTDVTAPSVADTAPRAVTVRLGAGDVPRDDLGVPSAIFDEVKSVACGKDAHLELSMYWRDARMSVLNLAKPRPVTVGIGAVDLPATLPKELSDKFVIAQPVSGGVELMFTTSMRVEVRGDDEMPLGLDRLVKLGRVDPKALGGKGTFRLKLEPGERIVILMGDIAIAARWVRAPKRISPVPFAWLDKNFAAVLALVLVVHAIAVVVLLMTPAIENELPIEMLENPTRVARLVLEERAKKPKPVSRTEAAGSKGGKRKGDEGAAGRPNPDAAVRDAAPSTKGAPRVDPNKKEQDRRVAMNSGLLQVLGSKPGGATASVFGPGGLGSGINDALGGLRGAKMGEANGVGGSGGKGSNLGGGGKSLGIGGVGNGPGSGKGLANVELGGKGRATEVVPGHTVVKGCMTQEVVGRVVSRSNTQVKFCYEKELQKKPDLAGKIVAAFTIGASGDVVQSRVAESSLGDANVEQCVIRVVSHMRFPPCEGGGTAEITYPWLFKAGGQ